MCVCVGGGGGRVGKILVRTFLTAFIWTHTHTHTHTHTQKALTIGIFWVQCLANGTFFLSKNLDSHLHIRVSLIHPSIPPALRSGKFILYKIYGYNINSKYVCLHYTSNHVHTITAHYTCLKLTSYLKSLPILNSVYMHSLQPRSQGLSSSRSRGREDERPWERGWHSLLPILNSRDLQRHPSLPAGCFGKWKTGCLVMIQTKCHHT